MMKTMREFYQELHDKHGIVISSMFHTNLDETLSDEEYDKKMDLMVSMDKFFDEEFEGDEDEEDGL